MEPVRARGNPFGGILIRYVFAIHASVGMAIIYGLKVCMSVAMVSMLNYTALSHGRGPKNASIPAERDECGRVETATNATQEDGPFVWSEGAQGLMLSAYFWGYIVAQLPGGRIAEQYSAKWVMFFSVAINVICTLLTPVAAYCHFAVVIIMRVGEGIGGGVTFPACHVLLAKWAPPNERSVMSAIVYAGTSLGTVISLLLSGIIASELNWEAIFYIFGGLSAIWMIFWTIFVYDSPQKQPFINQSERDYIVESLGSGGDHGHSKIKTPWRAVLTSAPFWAIAVAHTCSNWGWYMILIELPFFMKQVLKFSLSENAASVSLPFLSLWIFSMGLSKTLDTLKAKGKISTTCARKTATLIASVVPTGCLIGLCISSCDRTFAVVMTAIATTAMGGMFCGFLANHIDIAPNHAGTLMAITNSLATLPGITVPLFVGALTHDNPNISSWRIIFYVTIVLFAIEMIVYTIFGSGEEQKWNKPQNESDDEKKETQPLRG